MNLILFGPPGAGKGTQSELLIKRCKMRQISTGDLFRSAIKNQTELGKLAKSYMDKGSLVPDEVTIRMLEEALAKNPNQVILDGFPRNIAQANALEGLLFKFNTKVDKAIFLHVPNEILVDRLTGRRVCKNCSSVYHIKSKPTKQEGVCDSCGGEVVQRADDKSDVVISRLKVYEDQTSPLKEYFKGKGQFVEVNGNRETEEVFESIKGLL